MSTESYTAEAIQQAIAHRPITEAYQADPQQIIQELKRSARCAGGQFQLNPGAKNAEIARLAAFPLVEQDAREVVLTKFKGHLIIDAIFGSRSFGGTAGPAGVFQA